MTKWVRWYWDQEDLWFWLEVDDDGWVTRQVELQGELQTPTAAASLAEWLQIPDESSRDQYQEKLGKLVAEPFSEYELRKCQTVTAVEFENVWAPARRVLEGSQSFSIPIAEGIIRSQLGQTVEIESDLFLSGAYSFVVRSGELVIEIDGNPQKKEWGASIGPGAMFTGHDLIGITLLEVLEKIAPEWRKQIDSA